MIHMKESTSEIIISRLEIIKAEGKYKAKWLFNAECADGFIIILTEIGNPDDRIESKVLDTLKSFFADRELQGSHNLDSMQIKVLHKLHYKNGGIPLTDIRKVKQPLNLMIVPYRSIADSHELLWQSDGENTAYIPCLIEFEKTVVKPLFGSLLGKNIRIDMRIPAVKGYPNGALYYVLDNKYIRYPIAESMLGKEFSVELTKSGVFEMRVDKRFQHLYKCRECDGGK